MSVMILIKKNQQANTNDSKAAVGNGKVHIVWRNNSAWYGCWLWESSDFNGEEILHTTIIKFTTLPDLCVHLTWKKLKPTFLRNYVKNLEY